MTTEYAKVSARRAHRPSVNDVFKALASEQRREILRLLGEAASEPGKTCCAADELCGCRLSDRLGIAPSTISHHMSLLLAAGLVAARRDGKWVYYTLRRDALEEAARELKRL